MITVAANMHGNHMSQNSSPGDLLSNLIHRSDSAIAATYHNGNLYSINYPLAVDLRMSSDGRLEQFAAFFEKAATYL
jgi:hypothetical protein